MAVDIERKQELKELYEEKGKLGMFYCEEYPTALISFHGCFSRFNYSLNDRNVSKVAYDEHCRTCETGKIIADILGKKVRKIRPKRPKTICSSCKNKFPAEEFKVWCNGRRITRPYCKACSKKQNVERAINQQIKY